MSSVWEQSVLPQPRKPHSVSAASSLQILEPHGWRGARDGLAQPRVLVVVHVRVRKRPVAQGRAKAELPARDRRIRAIEAIVAHSAPGCDPAQPR